MGEKSETERSGLYEELKSQILQRVDLSREVSDEEMQELIDEVILTCGKEKRLSLNEKYRNYGQWNRRDFSGKRRTVIPLG